MAGRAKVSDRAGGLFGVAGFLMALCCVAGPAVLGAAAGAAIGNVVGIVAAVVVALIGALLVRRWRRGGDGAC
jgi:hypothetical protein